MEYQRLTVNINIEMFILLMAVSTIIGTTLITDAFGIVLYSAAFNEFIKLAAGAMFMLPMFCIVIMSFAERLEPNHED
jgi:hypothetical protein